MLDRAELHHHFEMLERLPIKRLQDEMVLRMVGDENIDVPAAFVEEAHNSAHTIDVFLPILIQRARNLGPIAEMETLGVTQELEQAVKESKLPPSINGNRAS